MLVVINIGGEPEAHHLYCQCRLIGESRVLHRFDGCRTFTDIATELESITMNGTYANITDEAHRLIHRCRLNILLFHIRIHFSVKQ